MDGQYNLGIFYLNGWGVEQDKTMAARYLAAASAQGDEGAELALQGILGANKEPNKVEVADIRTPKKGESTKANTSADNTTNKIATADVSNTINKKSVMAQTSLSSGPRSRLLPAKAGTPKPQPSPNQQSSQQPGSKPKTQHTTPSRS